MSSEPEELSEVSNTEDVELESKKIVFELEGDVSNEMNTTTLNTFESSSMISKNIKVESREREGRLREISQQLRTPSGLTKLEDVPAYKRNNIELDEDIPDSSEDVSSVTLNDEGENQIIIKNNNSFLHDNVD